MSQNCTILCPADDTHRVVALVRALIGKRGRTAVSGDASAWSTITVRSSAATLILNRRVFVERGDEFSKMRLGMWFYFDRVKTEHPRIKQEVLRRIEEFALAIGVVAEPEFAEEAGHFDCIYGLAEALGGIIWNGSSSLNHEGKTLLDQDGHSEVPG